VRKARAAFFFRKNLGQETEIFVLRDSAGEITMRQSFQSKLRNDRKLREEASRDGGGEVETNEGGNEGQDNEQVGLNFGFHHKGLSSFQHQYNTRVKRITSFRIDRLGG
jgi:hypothetical protein